MSPTVRADCDRQDFGPAHSTPPLGVRYTSIEIKVSYLRPVAAGVELTAHGWVTKPGRRAAFAEGDVRDPAGVLLAAASSTCLVM